MDHPIGSPGWYDDRTALFELMPDAIWGMANRASVSWMMWPDVEVWSKMIDSCHNQHPEFDRHEIQQAFECERDDVLGQYGEDLS